MKNHKFIDSPKKNENSEGYNRRNFVKAAGLSVLGVSASPFLFTANRPNEFLDENEKTISPKIIGPAFPAGFLWGTATASYQVEGAAHEDGRGMTIWDTFSHTQGKVLNNDTGDIACDMYHRYKSDIQLMKALNVKSYRFSIAWSRIFPDGSGTPNQKGVDFYNRLTDELLANDIEPFATLYHWDLPQTLQDKYKGWQSRETAKAFADYAGFMAGKLSDRVKYFFTLNELSTFIELGYGIGMFAPGLKLSTADLNQARHHSVLAHGLAVQAIRANSKAETKVGAAENINIAVPIIETPENIKIAEIVTREMNAGYMTVIQEGRYTDKFLKKAGADAPEFTDEDLKIISSPIDFLGINVYQPHEYVQAANNEDGFEIIPIAKSHPRTTSPWHTIAPEALYWGARHVHKIWGVNDIFITENGFSGVDELNKDGHIYDTDRIMYLKNYLTQLQRAVTDGVPVKGYFYWSLMDNFEWASGYGTRFGLYYLDYKTLERFPKLSASYYKSVAENNKVM